MFTPFGWVLPFQRVFGMGHLAAPTGEGGDEGEGATNIITGHFQQTPQIIFQPLVLNLKLELVS